MHIIIDDDTQDKISAPTLTEALAFAARELDGFPMLSGLGAESWAEVAAECEAHTDGMAGVIEGFTHEERDAAGFVGERWSKRGIDIFREAMAEDHEEKEYGELFANGIDSREGMDL